MFQGFPTGRTPWARFGTLNLWRDFSLSIGLGMHLCPPDELEDLAEEREDCLSLFRLLLCNPNLDKWHTKLTSQTSNYLLEIGSSTW